MAVITTLFLGSPPPLFHPEVSNCEPRGLKNSQGTYKYRENKKWSRGKKHVFSHMKSKFNMSPKLSCFTEHKYINLNTCHIVAFSQLINSSLTKISISDNCTLHQTGEMPLQGNFPAEGYAFHCPFR